MKKIVGIFLAGALVTSAFAANVNARVKLTGDIANFNGKDFTALKINNHASHDWEPDMALSVSEDRAGATVKFKTLNEWGSGEGETSTAWNIWFKPFDMLKVNVGIFDGNLNQETIDWSNTKTNFGGNGGYGLDINVAGISATVAFFPGMGNAWFAGNRIGNTVVKAAYSLGDIGTISGLFQFNGQNKEQKEILTGDVTYSLDAATGNIVAKQATKKVDYREYNYMKFALGYNSNKLVGDNISFFVNVIGAANANFDDINNAAYKGGLNVIRAEAFGNFSFDALNIKVFVPFQMGLDADNGKMSLGTIAKVGFGMSNGLNISCYLKAENWMDIAGKGITIKPGVTGKVGVMGWEAYVECVVGKSAAPFTVAVPVVFDVQF